MMRFRSIGPGDQPWMNACRDLNRNPFTALSFASLFTWRNAYGLTVAGDEDFFVIHSQHDRAYYCPCGDAGKCMRFIRETSRTEREAHFLYLTRGQAAALRGEGVQILMRDDLSEYIFDACSLALMEGHHASNSYKMKVRHFRNAYPYSCRPLTEEDTPFLRLLSRDWPDMNRFGDAGVLRDEIDYFGPLSLQGTLLETADGRHAYILGYENRPDEFTMTMTKHDPSLPAQVTAVLTCELACQLSGRYRLINLEEDLGIAGLRQAKLLYSPVDRLNVYEAFMI